jgi:TRAP-type uncharacterized transport system fused permease subunit
MAEIDYPATLSIDYPEEKRNRLTCVFRIFMVIPIGIILGLLIGTFSGTFSGYWPMFVEGIGLIFLPVLLMLLFCKKYPKWWFNWNLELSRFSYRVYAYFWLLRDEYPSTDEEQAIHLDFKYPDSQTELMRGMPLVKWFLAIPHYIVLWCLYIAVWVVSIIAWFAILFTGKYPKGMWEFVVSVMRWTLRVTAYAFLLITDKYPPFSLE